MAAGDPVVVSGDVPGGSTVTVSTPPGETWVISDMGDKHQTLLQVSDPNATGAKATIRRHGNYGADHDAQRFDNRPVVDETVELVAHNRNSSEFQYYLGGRQI